MAFEDYAVAAQGLEGVVLQKMNSDGLTYQDGFALPYPQLLGVEENIASAELPGGNQTADENAKTKSATFTLRWARLNLKQQAEIQGSFFAVTGGTGNHEARLKRRASDRAPFFKIRGRVDYVGSEMPTGDYLLEAYKAKMIAPPKFQHETDEKYATCEMQFKAFYRSDGEFYDLVLREQGAALSVVADNTPPTVSSTTPADNAADVSLTNPLLVGFSEPVQLDPSNYSLVQINSSTDVADVALTPTISSDHLTVTLAHAPFTVDKDFNLRIANVRDLAGNYQATPVNRQFGT